MPVSNSERTLFVGMTDGMNSATTIAFCVMKGNNIWDKSTGAFVNNPVADLGASANYQLTKTAVLANSGGVGYLVFFFSGSINLPAGVYDLVCYDDGGTGNVFLMGLRFNVTASGEVVVVSE